MGAEFLELDFEEEAGSGDGYAKVMSDAFIKAEMALFAAQAAEVDIIVTTALIPGRTSVMLLKWPVKVMESNGAICAAVTSFTSWIFAPLVAVTV